MGGPQSQFPVNFLGQIPVRYSFYNHYMSIELWAHMQFDLQIGSSQLHIGLSLVGGLRELHMGPCLI